MRLDIGYTIVKWDGHRRGKEQRINTVEFLVWNIVGTGLRAIPYDGYSTINKMNIKYKIS
jgi:hypothetical protein